MRGSRRILTIFSLVVLCSLSFAVVYGTENVDTQPQDPHHFFYKRDVPLHRRAIHHHPRAPPSSTPSSAPSSAPSPTPNSQTPNSSGESPTVTPSSKSSSGTPVSSSTSSAPVSSSTHSSTSSAGSTSTSKSPGTTTSSTSSKPSSTPSSTPPSSSSTTPSLSSSTSPTSGTSATSSVSNVVIVGSTNTPLASNLPGTSGSPSNPINPGSTVYASSTASSTSKGFFANKGAVSATFAIVGVVGGFVAILGAIIAIRRYRRAKFDDVDFYEKYPGGGGSTDHSSREPAELGQGPLGGSATDLTDPAPPDAYPDRAIHYGQPNPSTDFRPAPPDAYPDRAVHYGQPNPSTVFRPVDYGIDYPPDAAYADPADAPGTSDFASVYDSYDYEPNGPHSGSAGGGHPFADPTNASRAAYAPPVTYPHGRTQEMVTTDSYYGPNTAGVGVGGVGLAQ